MLPRQSSAPLVARIHLTHTLSSITLPTLTIPAAVTKRFAQSVLSS